MIVFSSFLFIVLIVQLCAGKIVTDPAEIQELLDAHNAARCEYGLTPFTWNADAATVAGNYADQCRMGHNGNRGPYGENIYYSWGMGLNLKNAVDSWNSEKAQYTCGTSGGGGTGHYTQNVWADTKSIGCGYAVEGQGCDKVVVVCNYSPPGNFIGRPPFDPSLCSQEGTFECGTSPGPGPSPNPGPMPSPPPPTPMPDLPECVLELGCRCLGGQFCSPGLDCVDAVCVDPTAPPPPTGAPPTPVPEGPTPVPDGPTMPPTERNVLKPTPPPSDGCTAKEGCACFIDPVYFEKVCDEGLSCIGDKCIAENVEQSETWDPNRSVVDGPVIKCRCAKTNQPMFVTVETRDYRGHLVSSMDLNGRGMPDIRFFATLEGGIAELRKRQGIDVYETYKNGIYRRELIFRERGEYRLRITGNGMPLFSDIVYVDDCTQGTRDCGCLVRGDDLTCKGDDEELACDPATLRCIDADKVVDPDEIGEEFPVWLWAFIAGIIVAVLVVMGVAFYICQSRQREKDLKYAQQMLATGQFGASTGTAFGHHGTMSSVSTQNTFMRRANNPIVPAAHRHSHRNSSRSRRGTLRGQERLSQQLGAPPMHRSSNHSTGSGGTVTSGGTRKALPAIPPQPRAAAGARRSGQVGGMWAAQY